MQCRTGCAACCIAPSISSPIVGMPEGKPAGVACIQLDDDWRCGLFGDARRPAVCDSLQASVDMCGTVAQGREYAVTYLERLGRATS